MLITVGIIFTLARARAGTVLASYLLHLGYNSMIAVTQLLPLTDSLACPRILERLVGRHASSQLQ